MGITLFQLSEETCCCSMIPIGSLFGAVLQCLGVAMFCSSVILGFNEALTLFESDEDFRTKVDDDVIYYLEIAVYSWTAFTMLWAIGVLFHAFMTTAQTSGKVGYGDGKVCCSSRGCIGTTLFFSAVILICWVMTLGMSIVPFTFSLMISGFHNGTDPTTVDFSYYGIPVPGDVLEVEGLEDISNSLVIFSSIAVGGAALVLLGLVDSIACMASNWVHQKVSDQWKDYAQKRRQEEKELHEMSTYKSSERLAQSLYY